MRPPEENDLRRRQQAGDVGWRRGANLATSKHGWRLVRLPLLLALLGVVLVYVGPVPGLGALLVLGGLAGAFMVYVYAWLGG